MTKLFVALQVVSALALPALAENEALIRSIGSLNQAARGLHGQYLVPRTKKPKVVFSELKKTLEERREKIADLARQDPEEAVKLFNLSILRGSVPAALQSLIEQRVSLQGQLEIVHKDSLEEGKHETRYFLRTKTERVPLYASQVPNGVVGGEEVKVSGGAFLKGVGLVAQRLEILKGLLPKLAVQKVAVIFIKFTDTAGAETYPNALARAKSEIFDGAESVSKYIYENSYGKASITGQVAWVSLPNTYKYYSDLPDDQYAQAVVNAADSQINWSGYTHIVTFVASGGGGGSGTTWKVKFNTQEGPINASFAEITCLSDVCISAYMVSHELLHGYGLNHAGGWICSNLVGENLTNPKQGCETPQYDDQFDRMGDVLRHLAMFRKESLGWTVPTNTENVTVSGQYSLKPVEKSGPETKQIKIPLGGKNYYALEYRRPIGSFDSHTPPATLEGVLIRFVPENLVTTPAGPMSSLIPEKRGCVGNVGCVGPRDNRRQNFFMTTDSATNFYDPYRHIAVSVLSMTESKAQVHVSFNASGPLSQ